MRQRQWLVATLVCASAFLSWCPASVEACAVPVFRYALERDSWHPSPYPVFLFHRGELDKEATRALDTLEAAETLYMENWFATNQYDDVKYPANVIAQAMNVETSMPEQVHALWTQIESESLRLPQLVVCLPPLPGADALQSVWSGDATVESARRILDSPVRRSIPQKIAEGYAAVWIFMESGDPVKDQAKARLIQEVLDAFTGAYEFDPAAIMAMGLESEDDLKLSFTMIHVKRNDPAEDFLKSILLLGQEEQRERNEPIVLPVFGRGRAFCALAGDEITAENVEMVCYYIAGGCSCEIKWQNPGIDLLISTDWYKILAGVAPPELPSDWTSTGGPATDSAKKIPDEPTPGSRTVRNLFITGCILLFGVVTLSIALHRRTRNQGG